MDVLINRRVLLLLLLNITIFGCQKKKEIMQDVFFLVEPFNANRDSVLKIMIINNTENNYFITLDTTRCYDYPDFNAKTNSSFILKPFVYNNGKLIHMIGEGIVQKRNDMNEKNTKSDSFYRDYIRLNNAIFLKKKNSKYIKIPFSLSYKLGIFQYHYDLQKDKEYELKLEYQMVKETTEKRVIKRTLDSVQKVGYAPYYEKIVSNMVPLIIR